MTTHLIKYDSDEFKLMFLVDLFSALGYNQAIRVFKNILAAIMQVEMIG